MQALFRRGQLKALVDAHAETEGLGGHLSADEISIIRGALDLTSKTAASCMTPMDKASFLVCLFPNAICARAVQDLARLSVILDQQRSSAAAQVLMMYLDGWNAMACVKAIAA